jgi:hypothetical protein
LMTASIGAGFAGSSAGAISGKMKCVNSAIPGPMKMNQATKAASGTRSRSPIAVR